MRLVLAAALMLAAAPAHALGSEEGAPGKGQPSAETGEAEHHGVAPINWFEWKPNKDAHGGPLDKGDEPMAPGLIFALANFAIFAFVLLKYARPVVKKYTEQRHQTIRDALEEGARLRAEARAKLDEYSQRIRGVESDVDKLIAEIRATAEAERKQILAQAEAQAAALRTEAEQRIAADMAQARVELQREVMLAALAIADQVIRERLGKDDQKRQFEAFVADLERGEPEVRP
jgi:F-type H+-transporting ATPase subunit b